MKKVKALGQHVVIDMFDCNFTKLDDMKFITQAALVASRYSKGRVLGKIAHKYTPVGVSVALFLAESHLFIHTWPEFGYLSADIFTCGSNTNPIIGGRKLIEILNPRMCEMKKLQRGLLAKVGQPRKIISKREVEKINTKTIEELEEENRRLRQRVRQLKQKLLTIDTKCRV